MVHNPRESQSPRAHLESRLSQCRGLPGGKQIKARLAELGATALPGSPADFGKLIADDTEKWGKVIRAANIKAE